MFNGSYWGFSKGSITPFDTSKGSYNVRLFPFQPLEQCQFKRTNLEQTIITRFNDMNYRNNLNLQIVFDTINCVQSYAQADSIGKKFYADLVIWGDLYEHCSIDNEACLKFVNISYRNSVPGIKDEGESGIQGIRSLSEIKEGKLQKDIDYIIYWISASNFILKQDFNSALNLFRKIENSKNITYELFYNIGICLDQLGSSNEALIYYYKAIEINPNFEVAHNNIAGTLNFFLNNKNGAKYHYEKALEINPNYVTAHNNYALLLQTEFNDSIGAKKHIEKALELDPDFYITNFNYGVILEKFHGWINAKLYYEKALEINPDFALAHRKYSVLLFLKFNDWGNAKKHYLKAIEIDSSLRLKKMDSLFGIK